MSSFVTKKIDPKTNKIEWNIFPEDFRIAAYLLLWFSAATGLFITTYYGDPSVFENNAIKSIWGYNNLSNYSYLYYLLYNIRNYYWKGTL